MAMTGLIYIVTSPSEKQYIGQTCQKMRQRKNEHLYLARHTQKNTPFLMAIRKYNDQLKWETYGPYPIEQLDLIERCYIYCLNTIAPNGYNLESGGKAYKKFSVETKKKISLAKLGKKQSLETRKARSLAWTGINNPQFGRQRPKEHSHKIAEALRGKKASEETRKKMSIAHLGHKVSETTREKMSLANKRFRATNNRKIVEEE